MTEIHSSAIVSSRAKIGENVSIGAYSIIEDDVEIGDGCEIAYHVVIATGARIGKNVKIFSGAVISTEPQDLKYRDEKTYAFIGDNTVIRECATVNRGTIATGKTVVGSDCLLMAYAHVAHDCIVGNNVILANASQLGGHVELGDWVILGGVVKVHQFCRVGDHAMVGADVKVVKDILPYSVVGRNPAKIDGINKIGLRRRGFTQSTIKSIENFYNNLLYSNMNTGSAVEKYRSNNNLEREIVNCLEFIESSKRGIYR
jgi:UDP-N-acetylglucosamine acyltransferase